MSPWIDGHPAASLPVLDRGLAYGDGLFETMAVKGGRPRLYECHRARLADGCMRLGIPLDSEVLDDEVAAFCRELGQGVAKLIVTRGDGMRGYASPAPSQPRRILLGSPMPTYPEQYAREGIELFPCATRLSEQPALAGMKHLNRLEQVLARAEWCDARYAEGLMLDVHGRLVEGVFSNLFLVCNAVLVTPELTRCGVAGVMRAALLSNAQDQGIESCITDLSIEDLHGADEVFVCNSLYGVWPVRRLGEQVWPVGQLTRTLQGLARTLLDSDS